MYNAARHPGPMVRNCTESILLTSQLAGPAPGTAVDNRNTKRPKAVGKSNKEKIQMKVVELPAAPEVLARVDLSQNGTDMLCAKGGLLGPRCRDGRWPYSCAKGSSGPRARSTKTGCGGPSR